MAHILWQLSQSNPWNFITRSDPVIKLIDKMSLGAGALKVEWPIVRKGRIALELAMATKRAPTTRHRHTEWIQWNNYHNPYLPIQGWEEWEQKQISRVVNSNDPQRSAKQSKAKQSRTEIYNHM